MDLDHFSVDFMIDNLFKNVSSLMHLSKCFICFISLRWIIYPCNRPGFNPASSDTADSEGWQMTQCWITYRKRKNPQNPPLKNFPESTPSDAKLAQWSGNSREGIETSNKSTKKSKTFVQVLWIKKTIHFFAVASSNIHSWCFFFWYYTICGSGIFEEPRDFSH